MRHMHTWCRQSLEKGVRVPGGKAKGPCYGCREVILGVSGTVVRALKY